VVRVIERILAETENLKQVAREFSDQDSGSLIIATTHTQARYSLPRVVTEFKRRYPRCTWPCSKAARRSWPRW